MLRRDMFNIFFGNTITSSLTQETVALIDTPSFLKLESTSPLIHEFSHVAVGQKQSLQVSTNHTFSISWSSISNSSSDICLHFGVKADSAPEQSPIVLGLHAERCLYIGELRDKRKLATEILNQDAHFKLDVTPQTGGLTYAKLTLTNDVGFTLAMVKNIRYRTVDWEGDIFVANQSLKYLIIEGRVNKSNISQK